MFQPKWKTGGSGLFGGRGWMGHGWKMGANSNLYRPNYGYAPNSMSGFHGGYQINDQLNISPLSLGSYQSNNFGPINDGWSAQLGGTTTYTTTPAVSPAAIQQFNNYDSYSSQPTPSKTQTSAPLVDSYSTKKHSGKHSSSTKK